MRLLCFCVRKFGYSICICEYLAGFVLTLTLRRILFSGTYKMNKMEVNRLLSDELTYELQIRGCEIPETVAQKRVVLRQALSSERTNFVVPEGSNFDGGSELNICQGKLDELLGNIQEFDGSNVDNEQKRINSRLIHVCGRVKRVVAAGRVQEEKKKFLSDLCQELFVALDDAVNIARLSKPGTSYPISDSLIDLENDVQRSVHAQQQPTAVDRSPMREEPVPVAEGTNLQALASRLHDLSFLQDREVPVATPSYEYGPRSEFLSRWKICFDGNSSVINFIEDVEEMARSRGVSKQKLFQSASELFKGDVLLWFRTRRHKFSSWDSLVSQLKDNFLPPDYELSLMDDIRKRTQGHEEGLLLYVTRMQSLFNKLSQKLPEKEQVGIIRRNLLPHLHTAMALHEVDTIEELVDLGRRIEDSHWRAKQYCPPSQNPRLAQEPELAYRRADKSRVRGVSAVVPLSPADVIFQDVPGGPVCWKCKQRGHLRRQCPLRDKIACFRCGAEGVTLQNCQSCSGNARASH